MTPSRFITWLGAPVFLIAVACGGTSKFRGDSDAEYM